MSTENDPVSFAEALNQVVKNLRQQPVLLFTLGALILVLAAGTLALPNLRVVIGAILALVFVGLIVWVVMEMEKMRNEREQNRPKTVGPAQQQSIRSGSIKAGDQNTFNKAVESGPVEATLTDNVSEIGSGDLTFGDGNVIDAAIGSGPVTVNVNKKKKDRQQEDEDDAKEEA